MKLTVIAICTLLLLASLPAFAAPLCEDCDYWSNSCEPIPGALDRCDYDENGDCYTYYGYCWPPRAAAQTTVLTEWKVASIEISRPALDSITITAPAAVAAVGTSEPAEQK